MESTQVTTPREEKWKAETTHLSTPSHQGDSWYTIQIGQGVPCMEVLLEFSKDPEEVSSQQYSFRQFAQRFSMAIPAPTGAPPPPVRRSILSSNTGSNPLVPPLPPRLYNSTNVPMSLPSTSSSNSLVQPTYLDIPLIAFINGKVFIEQKHTTITNFYLTKLTTEWWQTRSKSNQGVPEDSAKRTSL